MTRPTGARLLDGDYEPRVPVGRLSTHPRNPRRGSVGDVAASIVANGFYGAVIAQRSTGHVLAGNHRLEAARSEGLEELPVIWLDVDDDEALRILLVDNRTADKATYELDLLGDLLTQLEQTAAGLTGTGYTPSDLEALLEKLGADNAAAGGRTDADDAPDYPEEVISEPGDVWLIGRHRLVVGDARDPVVIERALNGGMADAVFTDPPYAVNYRGSGRAVAEGTERKAIAGDELDEEGLETLLSGALGNARQWTRPGGAWWVCGPPGPTSYVFGKVLRDLKVWRQSVLWVKDILVLGRQDYHYRHEAIFAGVADEPLDKGAGVRDADLVAVGWKPGAAHKRLTDRRQDTVWEIPRPSRADAHPTMKPVALVERALRNSTDPGAVVLDCFAGSGTTAIACHRSGRVAALVEKDPAYADVICRRWQAHTGVLPVNEDTRQAIDFTHEPRPSAHPVTGGDAPPDLPS